MTGALQSLLNFSGGLEEEEERTWSSYLPGTEAGEESANYWAERLVASGGNFTDDPIASTGLFFSVLWTDETALETASTLAGGGVLRGLSWAAGPRKQWIRIGKSYSHYLKQKIPLSIRWGASPTRGGIYLKQIRSRHLRELNQWLRNKRFPGKNWRAQDKGHFHLKRKK